MQRDWFLTVVAMRFLKIISIAVLPLVVEVVTHLDEIKVCPLLMILCFLRFLSLPWISERSSMWYHVQGMIISTLERDLISGFTTSRHFR
jgi:hypothetical protein